MSVVFLDFMPLDIPTTHESLFQYIHSMPPNSLWMNLQKIILLASNLNLPYHHNVGENKT